MNVQQPPPPAPVDLDLTVSQSPADFAAFFTSYRASALARQASQANLVAGQGKRKTLVATLSKIRDFFLARFDEMRESLRNVGKHWGSAAFQEIRVVKHRAERALQSLDQEIQLLDQKNQLPTYRQVEHLMNLEDNLKTHYARISHEVHNCPSSPYLHLIQKINSKYLKIYSSLELYWKEINDTFVASHRAHKHTFSSLQKASTLTLPERAHQLEEQLSSLQQHINLLEDYDRSIEATGHRVQRMRPHDLFFNPQRHDIPSNRMIELSNQIALSLVGTQKEISEQARTAARKAHAAETKELQRFEAEKQNIITTKDSCIAQIFQKNVGLQKLEEEITSYTTFLQTLTEQLQRLRENAPPQEAPPQEEEEEEQVRNDTPPLEPPPAAPAPDLSLGPHVPTPTRRGKGLFSTVAALVSRRDTSTSSSLKDAVLAATARTVTEEVNQGKQAVQERMERVQESLKQKLAVVGKAVKGAFSEQITPHQKTIEETKRQIAEAQMKLAAVEQLKIDLSSEIKQLNSRMEEYKQEESRLDEKIKPLLDSVRALKNDLTELDAECIKLEHKHQELETKVHP